MIYYVNNKGTRELTYMGLMAIINDSNLFDEISCDLIDDKYVAKYKLKDGKSDSLSIRHSSMIKYAENTSAAYRDNYGLWYRHFNDMSIKHCIIKLISRDFVIDGKTIRIKQ